VRLAFVGDISAVANRSAPECDPDIAKLLRSADLVIGNCESPVVERPSVVLGTRLGTHHAMSERFLAEAPVGSLLRGRQFSGFGWRSRVKVCRLNLAYQPFTLVTAS